MPLCSSHISCAIGDKIFLVNLLTTSHLDEPFLKRRKILNEEVVIAKTSSENEWQEQIIVNFAQASSAVPQYNINEAMQIAENDVDDIIEFVQSSHYAGFIL